MGFLDNTGLTHLWAKVKDRLALKMDKATYDPQGRGVDVFGYADTKQPKLYDLTLDTPILVDQAIDDNTTFTLPAPSTLAADDIYWLDVQIVWAADDIDRYQLLGKAKADDAGVVTVVWNGGEITLTNESVATSNIGGGVIVTLAKVTSIVYPGEHAIAQAEGHYCINSGGDAHVEGWECEASGWNSHAEGDRTIASGRTSHAEGYQTTASGESSHAEGYRTTASGYESHAEGNRTRAKDGAHAEGYNTEATYDGAHSEGQSTKADGYGAHAEGSQTLASGDNSHAEGYSTKASSENQHVQGKYNIEDSANKYAHIVGNGDFNYDDTALSNAHTLDWSGNGWFAGDVLAGGADMDAPAHKLSEKADKAYVDAAKQAAMDASRPATWTPTAADVGADPAGSADALKPILRTVTLPTSGWDATALTQTVSVVGVLADETQQAIHWAPAAASQAACYEAGVLCTAQGADSLTFATKKVPAADLTVYVTVQGVAR